jgi:hypothetical protein
MWAATTPTDLTRRIARTRRVREEVCEEDEAGSGKLHSRFARVRF